MPWTAEALEEQGAKTPTMLSETEEPPYEEILEAEPDVILANYSGITEEQYNKLSRIAPTVAYPDEAWSTPWRDVVTTTGEALGKTAEAAAAARRHRRRGGGRRRGAPGVPGQDGRRGPGPGAFYVYTGADPRVEFLEDLGFELAPASRSSTPGSRRSTTRSQLQETDKLTSDVLVSYHDPPRRKRPS